MAHLITIDGTRLSHKKIIIFKQNGEPVQTTNPISPTETGGWFNPRRRADFSLEADTFSVVVQSGVFASFTFSVDAQGVIQYPSEHEAFLGGSGTDTLTLKGFRAKFDFHKLISGSALIPSVMGNDGDPDLEWTGTASYILLPAKDYSLIAGSGLPALFRFNISNTGVLYSESAGDYFSIRTNKLTITGYPITIDARSVGYGQFWMEIAPATSTATGLIRANFLPLNLPGAYSMGASGGSLPQVNPSHQYFAVDALGNITVNDPFTLRVDASEHEKTITLLKPLSQIITDILLSSTHVQVGESVRVEVKSSNPSATIRINGVFGAEHYLQFGSAGTKTITVTASLENTFEQKTIDLEVVAFTGIGNLHAFPVLQHTAPPAASYKPLFSIPSNVFIQPDFTAHWDFGDGSGFITKELTVEHDYESSLDADQENYTFHVTCTIKQNNQPDVFVARTLYVHNIYVRCKKLGTIIAKTTNKPTAELDNGNWKGIAQIRNIEAEPITFRSVYIQSLTDEDSEVPGTLEALSQPLTIAPYSTLEYPVSVSREKITAGATGFSVLLAGTHVNGLEVRSESFFEFPLKSTTLNTSRLHALGVTPHLNLFNFGFSLPAPPVEGAECDPDNAPDLETDDSNWACQVTEVSETREVNSKFINARKGDIILSPSGPSGIIGELLASVDPPQYYGHCGIMTQNYNMITQCTFSDDRLHDNPNGSYDLPTNGFQPNAVKYGWPGVITQTVQNTINGEDFTDHDSGRKYKLGGFPGNTSIVPVAGEPNPVFGLQGSWQIIPAMVVKPDLLLELRYPEVRKKLYKVANEALNQTGKGHYRFYAYTDPTIAYDSSKFGTTDSGWAAGTFPSVCSSFIWYCIKNVQGQLESENAIVQPSDLEASDLKPYNGAEVNAQTRDGLYLYRADERLKAALHLSSAIKTKIQEEIDSPGPLTPFVGSVIPDLVASIMDVKDNIANQMVNAFSSDWCDEEAKDSERWKEQFDANAISPDNMLMWDSPLQNGLYGYATPLVVTPRREERVRIHRWKRTLLRGSLSGTVYHNGQPKAGALIKLSAFEGISDDNGHYIIENIPLGNYLAITTHTSDGVLLHADVPAHINDPQNYLDINLIGPSGNYRKLIVTANIRVRGDDTRDNAPDQRIARGERQLHFTNSPNARFTLTKKAPNGQFGSLEISARINLDRSIHIDLFANCSDFNGDRRAGSLIIGEGQALQFSNIYCEHNPTFGRSNFTQISGTIENLMDPVD